MAGVTLAQAQTLLDAYIAAETAVLTGQAYEIAGRKMTRANLTEIRSGRKEWEQQVSLLSGSASGRGRSRTMTTGGR
jgi:hypothetical protein